MGAFGGSAGAHLAAMLGTSFKAKALEGAGGNAKQSSRVRLRLAHVYSGAYELIPEPQPDPPGQKQPEDMACGHEMCGYGGAMNMSLLFLGLVALRVRSSSRRRRQATRAAVGDGWF